MSCDHELINEWACCSGKNASYITMVDITFCTFEYKLLEFCWEEQDNKDACSTVQKECKQILHFFGSFLMKVNKIWSERIQS